MPLLVNLSRYIPPECYLRRYSSASILFFISNFRHVLYLVCFLLGNSPASEFYMPRFRTDRVFRNVGI